MGKSKWKPVLRHALGRIDSAQFTTTDLRDFIDEKCLIEKYLGDPDALDLSSGSVSASLSRYSDDLGVEKIGKCGRKNLYTFKKDHSGFGEENSEREKSEAIDGHSDEVIESSPVASLDDPGQIVDEHLAHRIVEIVCNETDGVEEAQEMLNELFAEEFQARSLVGGFDLKKDEGLENEHFSNVKEMIEKTEVTLPPHSPIPQALNVHESERREDKSQARDIMCGREKQSGQKIPALRKELVEVHEALSKQLDHLLLCNATLFMVFLWLLGVEVF